MWGLSRISFFALMRLLQKANLRFALMVCFLVPLPENRKAPETTDIISYHNALGVTGRPHFKQRFMLQWYKDNRLSKSSA